MRTVWLALTLVLAVIGGTVAISYSASTPAFATTPSIPIPPP